MTAQERLQAFNTTPVVNVIQTDREAVDAYTNWLLHANRLPNETSVQSAKRVLGPQDYCWTGSCRHWIWERSFEVDFGDGRVETWRWRLFVSRRGPVLEVEDKYNRPSGDAIKVAGKAALNNFLKTWGSEAASPE